MAHDPDKVADISSAAYDALSSLRDLARRQEDDLLADKHLLAACKYHLVVAIEASLDLARHLIAANRWRVPEDYADTFKVLFDHGVLERGFARTLGGMARFRNVLVHRYAEVDDARVYQVITEDLGDIEAFFETVTRDLG